MTHNLCFPIAKKNAFLFLAPVLLAVGGCAQFTTATGIATQPTPIVAPVVSAKSWYYVESLCNIPEQAYKTLNEAYQLTPATKATVKPLLLKMIQLRKAAETAKTFGDATTFKARVADIMATYTQLQDAFPTGAIPAPPVPQ